MSPEKLEDSQPYANAGVERQNLFCHKPGCQWSSYEDEATRSMWDVNENEPIKERRQVNWSAHQSLRILRRERFALPRAWHALRPITRTLSEPLAHSGQTPRGRKSSPVRGRGKSQSVVLLHFFFFPWIPGTAPCCCLVLQTVTVLLYTQIAGSFHNLYFLLCLCFFLTTLCKWQRGGMVGVGWGGRTVKWRRPAIFTLILCPPRLFLSPSQRR